MNRDFLCSLSLSDFFSYLKDADGRECLIPLMEELRPFLWGRPADLSVLTTNILPESPPGMLDLCLCYLLGQALLYPERTPAPALSRLRDWIDPAVFLGGLPWDQVLAGFWRTAPVLVVDEKERVHRRYFIAGVCRGGSGPVLPAWVEPLLDLQAQSAVADAVRAVSCLGFLSPDQRPVCFPLLFSGGGGKIRDRSLGLPLALAFISAAAGKPMSERIAATGAMTEDGQIRKIGYLGIKSRFLFKEAHADVGPVRAFLYPAEQTPPKSTPPVHIPVASLQQAWFFTGLYDPGREDALVRFYGMLQDPADFVRNVSGISPKWLRWARENGYVRSVISAIISDPALFLDFVNAFELAVTRCELPIAREMAALVSPKELDGLRHTAPLTAFRWCSLNLALANHEGVAEPADVWIDRGRKLASAARRADLTAVADFFNYHCVSLHNRYRFHPEPPEYLQPILDLLEAQYEIQRMACPAFPVLGRLYGTLAQHQAFCGPDYLDQVTAWSKKARLALGRDSVPEYRPAWLRQYSYLAYAYLDAGKMKEAEQALFRFLEVTDWEDIQARLPGLSQWAHALLARFLADSSDARLCRIYPDRMDVLEKEGCGNDHPWQLWCWNRGRMDCLLGNSDGAEKWFRKSLGLCFTGRDRDTVRVMALLPLAGLHRIHRVRDAELTDREGPIRAAARRLNPTHFQMVIESTLFEDVLERVWALPGDLFPFSYR